MVQDPCTLNIKNDIHPNHWPLSATLHGVTAGRNPPSTKHTRQKREAYT